MLNFFFELQNNIQLYHWTCTNYARHKASDQLYTNITKLIDRYVETYFGMYGRQKLTGKLNVKQLNDTEIVKYLKDVVKYFNDLPDSKDTDLCNIRDEIISSIHQTLYLFTFH